MNIYFIEDTDGGNSTWIVAKSILIAISIFKKAYEYEPETIRLESQRNVVLIQNTYEPTRQELLDIEVPI